MTYKEALDYIFSFESLSAGPSLERIKELLSLAGNPQSSFRSIHVAGTNGKGSVSTYIASALTQSGYKTGLFTSPHVVSFCERICIDGEMIAEAAVAAITERLQPLVGLMSEKPTAFDLITAVGFTYFSEQKCDFAVLECGLGGAFDSTNAVDPILSVLCSISLDHVGVLGNSIEEITREKCGIIKSATPVVSYPFKKSAGVFNPQQEESQKIITEVSRMKQSKLIVADPDKITDSFCGLNSTAVLIDGLRLEAHLAGAHQIANMLTAYTAIKELSKQFGISDEAIVSGFGEAAVPARLETVSEKPLVIVDGGHNLDCARAIRLFAEKELSGRKLTGVIAIMKDKQFDSVLKETAGLFDKLIVTQVISPRACSADVLAEKAKKYFSDVEAFKEVRQALKRAKDSGNTVLVFGSFYLAGEAKEYFSR
ncbi:MAG: bifunctional folylpolyglutamate synthase/dihydrofolate synthase [Oscillospiraceae bacterium]|nr:bifunctional folylpolyglutamate synthase/dihydrofolate synthase [Oscillospiraceae bacterium]